MNWEKGTGREEVTKKVISRQLTDGEEVVSENQGEQCHQNHRKKQQIHMGAKWGREEQLCAPVGAWGHPMDFIFLGRLCSKDLKIIKTA